MAWLGCDGVVLGDLNSWLFERELDVWLTAGFRPTLWWRDDDARGPAPALSRLLEIADGRPLALAIVPEHDLAPLARKLSGAENVTISQHGVDHCNRREPSEPDGEYAVGTSASEISASVGQGRRRMADAGLIPAFYTPPWNRTDGELVTALPAAGFTKLSAWGAFSAREGSLDRLDAHVDLLRWSPRPRFRGRARFYRALTQQLRRRRKAVAWQEPIGLLTHHLDHDDDAWRFLTAFMAHVAQRAAWQSFSALTSPR